MAIANPITERNLFWNRSGLEEKFPTRVPRNELPADLSTLAFQAREMMLELGIRPEDNEFSRAIIAERERE